MKDFLSEQSVENRFFSFRIYIRLKMAKCDKKIVCFTKSLQILPFKKMPIILLYGRKTKNVTEIRVNFL